MKRAIAYIYLKRFGERDDLNNKFGKIFVDGLALQGYITQGTTKNSNGSYPRTWRKTKMTDEYFQIFIKPIAEADTENGRYLHALGF
jgi:hypothetical protein